MRKRSDIGGGVLANELDRIPAQTGLLRAQGRGLVGLGRTRLESGQKDRLPTVGGELGPNQLRG